MEPVRGRHPQLAVASVWLAWVAALALTTVAVALGWQPAVGDWWLNLPLATAYPLAGAIILTSRPGHPIGRLMTGVGLAAGLAIATHQYATQGIVLDPGSLPFATVAAWVGSWMWALAAMPAMTILPLLFPDGRLLSRRWRPVLITAVAAVAFAVVGFGLAPGRLTDFPSVHNPVGIRGLGPVTGLLQGAFFPLILIATAGAVASLVVRSRHGDPRTRQPLRLVIVSMVVFVALVVFVSVLPLPLALSATVQVGAALLVPAAIVIGVLQRGLFDIRVVVKPSLVYAALTVSVLGLYVTVVQLVGRLGGHPVGLVVATGVVAVAFEPLHRRLHRGVDRLLHGDRADPSAAAARLAGHLSASTSPGALLAAAAVGVGEALQVPGVRVIAVDGERVVGRTEWGVFPTDVERIPIRFYEGVVGHLEVAQREPHAMLGCADRRVLSRLLPHVGTAMHIVVLTADLNAAREQAVLAREEERRRIRRDLHDGLGPVLAGLGLGLEGVADLVTNKPDHARDLLAELAEAVHGTIDDVRRLVYELRPPSLDDLGLLGALREHANSIARRPGAVAVTVDAPNELPALPAAVEVAIFRIAMEALTNVERHAHASSCTIRLRVDDGIEITVEDDGVGINGRGSGVGLSSMQERVRELNGLWSLETRQPTGTRLRAQLPLSST
jgi:two-component system NarL family sensor kinase